MRRFNVACAVVVAIGMSMGGGVPAGAQLIDEDFDGYVAGTSPPPPWWYWGSSGTILVDDTVYFGGAGNSLEFNRVAFDYQPFATGQTLNPSLVGQGELTYHFLLSGGSTREVLCVFGRNVASNAVAWWVTHGGWFGNAVATYSNSQGWTHVMDVADNTWYGVRVDIDVDAHSYDITVWEDANPGNTATVTGVDFRDLSQADPVDEIQLGDFYNSSSDLRLAHVDDLRLVGPRVFADDFETGNTGAWSVATP